MNKNVILPIIAFAAAAAAAGLVFKNNYRTENAGTAVKSISAFGNDIVVNEADITPEASYYDYDADGTTIQLFAVKADDGTVRLALNTCQVCMGSPYAYFVQEGDAFVCQNCGNVFETSYIGVEHGGCNPVPITEENYVESNEEITVSAEFLNKYKSNFANWKKGIEG